MIMLLTLIGSVHPMPANAAGALADNTSKRAQQAAALASGQASPYPTQITRMHLFKQAITWFGQVESRHNVPLVSRVAGRIVSLTVPDEASVQAGDVLFELAGTAIASQITDLQQQRRASDRELALARKNLQFIRSKKQQHLATNEQLNAAKNALAQLKIRISGIKQRLISLASGIRITAPVDGVFTARSVQLGQYITAGTVLARIIDTHHLRIRASLFPPAHITRLVGQRAVIHGLHGDTTGVVAAIMPETTAAGGIQVWIVGDAVQQPQRVVHLLSPGMSLSGYILLPHTAVAVPQAAIARDDANHAFVFIRSGNGWRKQQIITGIRDQDWVAVRSGLHVGDQIAGAGAYEMLYRDFSTIYHEPD